MTRTSAVYTLESVGNLIQQYIEAGGEYLTVQEGGFRIRNNNMFWWRTENSSHHGNVCELLGKYSQYQNVQQNAGKMSADDWRLL